MILDLNDLGWSDDLQRTFDAIRDRLAMPELRPARVSVGHGDRYDLMTPEGPLAGRPTGRLRRETAPADRPVTGDWVAYRDDGGSGEGGEALVHAVLPRATRLARQAAGRRAVAQVLAANVDVVFVVTACGQGRNARRVERFIAMVLEGGATPVVVLNKIDLDPAWPMELGQLEDVAVGAPVVAISALEEAATSSLAPWLTPGRTIALVGPSGVGKSTLLNRLAGDESQATAAVREADGKGRHTTTHRELVVLPADPPGAHGLLLDTPGIRELVPWGDVDDIEAVFGDIRALAEQCRFRDCTHNHEPGCAVLAAVEDGELDDGRLDAHQRLIREAEFAGRRRDAAARQEERRQGRDFAQRIREVNRAIDKRR